MPKWQTARSFQVHSLPMPSTNFNKGAIGYYTQQKQTSLVVAPVILKQSCTLKSHGKVWKLLIPRSQPILNHELWGESQTTVFFWTSKLFPICIQVWEPVRCINRACKYFLSTHYVHLDNPQLPWFLVEILDRNYLSFVVFLVPFRVKVIDKRVNLWNNSVHC